MKHYKIRITDGYGSPRIVTVQAHSVVEALSSVEINDGERIERCYEI